MVKIVADTTSTLPLDVVQRWDIAYLPQIIVFGEQAYRDDTELNSKEFVAKLRASPVLPKTAAPPPALYMPIYEKLSQEGHTIIVLCPSKDVSGTFRSAEIAAQDFPDADIRVIDTRCVAANLGTLVVMAAQWADEGLGADEIVERVMELAPKIKVYAVVDTLEYLYKGGRIGGAKMLMGSLLQVKPIIAFKEGFVDAVEQQRTKRRAIARLKELIIADCPRGPEAHLAILHGDAEEEAVVLAAEMKQILGLEEVPIFEMPPAILVHAGPGILGATYFID